MYLPMLKQQNIESHNLVYLRKIIGYDTKLKSTPILYKS